jgi:LCP family protein required for cell wall assembly
MVTPKPVTPRTSPYSSRRKKHEDVLPVTPKISASKLKKQPIQILTPEERLFGVEKKQSKLRPYLGSLLTILILGILTYGGIIVFSALRAHQNTFIENSESSQIQSNAALQLSQNKKVRDLSAFKQVGDGRLNILLLGVGGGGHGGAYLTDSMKIISFDAKNRSATVTSIPRDFLYQGSKLNAIYTFGEEKKKGGGFAAIKKAMSEIIDAPIAHAVMLDFNGFKEVVDALGGIEVAVPSDLYDPSYPNERSGYEPFRVKAGVQRMDGTTALKYARTRKADSDFERQERQNLLITSIRTKALSAGVLTNPVRLNQLITALSSHLRTDLVPAELVTLAQLGKEIENDAITSYVLDTSPTLNLITSTNQPPLGYTEVPRAGVGNFSAIARWFQKNSPDPNLKTENQSIVVRPNGTVSEKQLKEVVAILTDYGFSVQSDTASTASVGIHANTKQGVITNRYLANLTGLTTQDTLPDQADTTSVMVINPQAASRIIARRATAHL